MQPNIFSGDLTERFVCLLLLLRKHGIALLRPLFSVFTFQDLRDWLDGAKQGFIFMSFGSIVRASFLGNNSKQRDILDAFAVLRDVRVLWKADIDAKSLPPNVRLGSWLPQNDILGENMFTTRGQCEG